MLAAVFNHTAFVAHVLTGASATYNIPQPAWADDLGAAVQATVTCDALVLTGPPANAGNVYVCLDQSAATAADLVLRPGDSKEVSGSNFRNLKAIADNVGDILEVTALYL